MWRLVPNYEIENTKAAFPNDFGGKDQTVAAARSIPGEYF